MSRTGLGRHGAIEENAGDPLDGLVNLFDVGMVLAVAFLIAGLGLTLHIRDGQTGSRRPDIGSARALANPPSGPSARGRGEPVGRVYRLADGRLVFVKRP